MKRVFVLALALNVTACLFKDEPAAVAQPGQIQLVPLKGLEKNATAASNASTTYEFNLDTAKSSVADYFIMQNTGGYNITNMTIVTNNSQFYFTPSVIPVIPPSSTSSWIQVLKLSVIHGVELDGVGYANLLPMGENTATAQITATTTNAQGAVITLTQSAIFKVYAKLTNLAIYRPNGAALDLSQHGLVYSVVLASIVTDPVPDYPLSDTGLNFANTGNSPFKVRVWHTTPVAADSFEVQAGGNFHLSMPAIIEIDREGVTSDPKLPVAANGKIYLSLGS